jgi:GNAT superfamily N-acetyltransferase
MTARNRELDCYAGGDKAGPQMADPIRIRQLLALPPEVETLRSEAIRQDFGFLDRLVADWVNRTNTFSRPGECLLGGFVAERLIEVGGLNVDPYLSRTNVGRLRRVYVLDDWRRQGIGRLLVDRLLDEAKRSFGEVRLGTDTARAASFYVRCGFSLVNDATASNAVNLA